MRPKDVSNILKLEAEVANAKQVAEDYKDVHSTPPRGKEGLDDRQRFDMAWFTLVPLIDPIYENEGTLRQEYYETSFRYIDVTDDESGIASTYRLHFDLSNQTAGYRYIYARWHKLDKDRLTDIMYEGYGEEYCGKALYLGRLANIETSIEAFTTVPVREYFR